MKCKECEMLNETIIIEEFRISSNPFEIPKYKECEGYKCLWNGAEEININNLNKHGCRLK